MRLRPYKSCDAVVIEKWIQDKDVFQKWGGERFGAFPISASVIDEKYTRLNGDCIEKDNFYPWIAMDEDGNAVGHFIMRYTNGDNRQWRFGWVIVDDAMRGKGYGKQMLLLNFLISEIAGHFFQLIHSLKGFLCKFTDIHKAFPPC